jgi:hypothetical protein
VKRKTKDFFWKGDLTLNGSDEWHQHGTLKSDDEML